MNIINLEDVKLVLSDYLKFIKETSSDYIFRCPYCGDSKNPNHGHLYVAKHIPAFNCFRCGMHGHINKLFNDIGLDISVKSNKVKEELVEIHNNTIKYVTESRIVKSWFNYLMDRFKVSETQLLSAVPWFSLVDPLIIPSLEVVNYSSDKMKDYINIINDGNMILFTTFYKSKIIGRYIDPNKVATDTRYRTFVLNKIPMRDVYIIYDPENVESIDTVYITEGVFDSIGLYFKFGNKHTMFISVLGNNVFSGLKFYDTNFIHDNKISIKFVLDNDNHLDFFKTNLVQRLNNSRQYFRNYSFEIYTNLVSKDTGGGNIELVLLNMI